MEDLVLVRNRLKSEIAKREIQIKKHIDHNTTSSKEMAKSLKDEIQGIKVAIKHINIQLGKD